MNKEDNIDAIKFYVKQKQVDEMREYTKDYGRDQFVWALVNQREEIAYLKQALNEIREYCNNTAMTVAEYKELLQIIDKYMKEDD